MLTLKDSGTREEFSTGAVRDARTDKGRFDLLPYHAIERVAKVFEAGSRKYTDRNWEKGIPTHRFMDSGLRHLMKYLGGHRDEDHLAQAAWNLLCLLETEHRILEGRLPESLLTLPDAPYSPQTAQSDILVQSAQTSLTALPIDSGSLSA